MAATTQHFDTLGAAEELEAAGLPTAAAKAISLVVDRSRESRKIEGRLEKIEDAIVEIKTGVAVMKGNIRHIFWVLAIQSAALVAILLKLF